MRTVPLFLSPFFAKLFVTLQCELYTIYQPTLGSKFGQLLGQKSANSWVKTTKNT